MIGLTNEQINLLDARINMPKELSSYKQIALNYGYKSPERVRQIILKAKRILEHKLEKI